MINVLIAPSLHVQPAADAVEGLADDLADLLDGLASDLRGDWSRPAADRWLDRAREVGRQMQRADRRLARAEKSARFHPMQARSRPAQPGCARRSRGWSRPTWWSAACAGRCLNRTYFVLEPDQAYPEQGRSRWPIPSRRRPARCATRASTLPCPAPGRRLCQRLPTGWS